MKQCSIMIVDDDEVDRYSLKRLLKSAAGKIPVEEASDGEMALEFFENTEASRARLGDRFPPVIVFLDINMPRMNGFEFLDEFKKLRSQNECYNAIVFLMVTSSDNDDDKERASQYDFVKGYIKKMPTTPSELLGHIKDYLPD